MVANICRLCYEKKARPIAIFSGKGAKLKIAETIRQHFPDTVLQNDDLLPKFVCASCWSKLENFHEFYCAVDVAKNAYLEGAVKEEVPNFIEIFCVGHVEDEASEEDESMGIEVTNLEATSPDHQSQNQSKSTDLIKTEVSNENDRDNEKAEPNERTECKTNSISEDESVENANDSDKGTDETPAEDSNQLDSSHLRVKCVLCDQLLGTAEEVTQHYRVKHNESAHHKQVTTCCDRKLIPSDIRGHYRYHLNPDVFRCAECGKSFKLLKSLKLHQQTHLPKKFECEYCEAKFSKRVEVKRHKVIAHGVITQRLAFKETASDRYPLKHCDICKKTFPKMWLLKTHIMRKHATKRFECEVCKKSFGTERILLFHVRQVHERRFDRVCHICAKVYSSIAELKKHLPAHSSIKQPRLHCQICGNSYKNIRILKQHMDVHKDEGQVFSCTQCPKTYPNRSILATHIRNVHNFKWRKCNFCEKECKTNRELKEHVATHTGEYLYGCIYCSQKFKGRPSLYSHKRQHHPIEWKEERPNPRPKKTIPE